jgi:GNAT superfamily N-acetyltransferase
MDREAFEARIYENWARHFGCRVSDMHRSGTILLPTIRYAGARGIHIWYIGQGSFVQMDPHYALEVAHILASLAGGTTLSGDDLQTAWGREAIDGRSAGLIYYLYPADLLLVVPVERFVLRRLAWEDTGYMQALYQASAGDEVSEAYVAVDHDIAFGCFAGDQLVAAGSAYQRAGFMDLSVLTHPGFRGLGLGRAVVAALCQWCIARALILQYRCDEEDNYSRSLAEGLGFALYFRQESLWLASDTWLPTDMVAGFY